MTAELLNELRELAERYCPIVLLDLIDMSDSDSMGTLLWLRRKDAEARNESAQ